LAVIMAVDKWRPYLQRGPFQIVTDHKSLCNLEDQILTTDLQRKAMAKLVGLQFQIKYRKGSDNGAADSLSRVGHLLEAHAISTLQPDWVQEVSNSYVTDTVATQLLQELAIQSPNAKGYALKKGLITYKGRMYIGANLALQTKLIAAHHDTAVGGHSGIQATYHRLKQLYYWPGLKVAVENYIHQCIVCQQ
uniref:Integrase zinc-binding domain-containing protein n=1 Tax=Aegilops tauschii subsp. strangulata TaxID=200361 RepID=A0A453HXK3_AEGTS